jgi:nitrile hydratase
VSHVHTDEPDSPAHRGRVLERLLEEAGVVTGAELDAFLDRLPATSSPANGARIVARAWSDDEFRQRLLDDGAAAIAELGYSVGGGPAVVLRVVENTEQVHNVVVCTLCSCYPLALLGPSPSWYKSDAYRARVVRDPRGVLAEFGYFPNEHVTINVLDANAETRYLVLPRRPAGTDGLSEEGLAKLVTRRGLIGTAAV